MSSSSRIRAVAFLLAAIASTVVAPVSSIAHFLLESPAATNEQSALGNPQLDPPCGDENAVPTGAVTSYQSGQTIEITIDETIFHPGHYRVALAVGDISELPPDPIVTPQVNNDCAVAEIMETPVLPILADGVLQHTAMFEGPQTFPITLPEGVTCEHCTLQIIEFIQNHSAPCFHHQCAALSVPEPNAIAAGLACLAALAELRRRY